MSVDVNYFRHAILKTLTEECILEDKVQVEGYIMNRKDQIIKNHIDNVFPIKEPGEKGGNSKYWMTKLNPHNRKNDHKIYGKDEEELKVKIIAHYMSIKDESKITVREALLKAVDDTTETGLRLRQRFDKHLGCLAKVRLSSLSEKHIREALTQMKEKKLTENEFNQTVSSLNKIADYCAYEHIEVCNIREIIETFRKIKLTGKHDFKMVKKQNSDLAFNRAEASKIIRHALKNPSYKRLAIALLIVTGLRAGEMLGLMLEDIYLKDGYLWIHQKENTKTYELEDYVKENIAREVYLSSEAYIVVKACLEFRSNDPSKSPFLFLNSNSADGKMHLRAIDDCLREEIHKKVLGLDVRRDCRSAHDCRRTYASLEYINGTDIYTLMKQLGHSSIKQTEDYIKDVLDSIERKNRVKGCGLLMDISAENAEKPSIYAVDASRRKSG